MIVTAWKRSYSSEIPASGSGHDLINFLGVVVQVRETDEWLHTKRGLCRDRERAYMHAAVSCMTFAWLLLFSGAAHAEGNMHLGQLRIHPYVKASQSTNDNVFNTPENPKRDTVTTYAPGLQLEREFGRHRAEARYGSVINRHDKYKKEDTTNHNAYGLLDFKLGSRSGLQFSDVYIKGHEDRGYSSTGLIERFKNNTGTVSATYQLADRSKVQFDAQKIDWSFKTSDFRNRDEALYSGYLYYRFLPKTSAFIEVDRRNVVFSDPTLGLNNTVFTGFIGLRWNATAKSNGVIKWGILEKNFKNPLQKDYSTSAGAIDLHHAFSEYTNITLIGERLVHEANLPGTRYQVTTGAFMEFSHRFLRRLGISVRGSYGNSVFSDPIPPDIIVRKDRTAVAGGGLKYFFRDWLDFGVDYSTRTRHSNIPVNDFKEHVTMVFATFAL